MLRFVMERLTPGRLTNRLYIVSGLFTLASLVYLAAALISRDALYALSAVLFLGAALLIRAVHAQFLHTENPDHHRDESSAAAKAEPAEKIEDTLSAQQEELHRFQDYLKALQDVSIELSKEISLDDVYRKAIELGRARLGFDRLGLFLLDDDTNTMVGTFGTDAQGNIRDERDLRTPIPNDNSTWVREALNHKARVSYRSDTALWDNWQIAGHGWNAMSALWNGEQIIGWLAADNLLTQQPLSSYRLELLGLLGSFLGHLHTQKSAERRLFQSQEHLRLALQAAQMRTWDWNITSDQITRDETGTWIPPYSTYQEFVSHIHPDDRQHVLHALARAVSEGTVYTAEYRFETPGVGLRWLYTVGQLYRDSHGQVSGMVGVTQDITERKQAEEALKVSEERFYQAFHGNPSAISITTVEEGRYVDVNESWLKLFGFTREEAIGRSGTQLNTWLYPGDDARMIAHFQEHGSIRGMEIARRAKSGQVIHLLMYADRVEIAGQHYYLSMSQDITEHKIAEKQALELALERERVSLLKEFIGNISHDLKTPLTVINNSLFLLERITEPQKQKDHLGLMKLQTQLLNKYIQDILTISRLDHTPELNLTQVNLNQVIRDIHRRLQPSAEKKIIAVTLSLEPDTPSVLGDVSELDRALTNLLENALNYTPDNGSVRVETRRENDQIAVEISDSGIGINPDDIIHIFERFYRANQARSTLETGTGLGLAIVKKIVDMHQGSIQVESQPGKGSIFRIWLPAA